MVIPRLNTACSIHLQSAIAPLTVVTLYYLCVEKCCGDADAAAELYRGLEGAGPEDPVLEPVDVAAIIGRCLGATPPGVHDLVHSSPLAPTSAPPRGRSFAAANAVSGPASAGAPAADLTQRVRHAFHRATAHVRPTAPCP